VGWSTLRHNCFSLAITKESKYNPSPNWGNSGGWCPKNAKRWTCTFAWVAHSSCNNYYIVKSCVNKLLKSSLSVLHYECRDFQGKTSSSQRFECCVFCFRSFVFPQSLTVCWIFHLCPVQVCITSLYEKWSPVVISRHLLVLLLITADPYKRRGKMREAEGL